MRLRLTLIDSRPAAVAGPTEVLVDAPADATFQEIRDRLTRLVCRDEDLRAGDGLAFEVSGRVLDDDAVLGRPPLLRGAVIVVVPPHASRPPSGSVGLADLHIVGGPGAGSSVALGRGDHVLGRSTSCSVRLHDAGVSRAHCLLSVGDGEIRVRDLQPANPSSLDESPLPQEGAVLTAGALLRVGSTTLMLGPRSTPSVPHGIQEGRVLVHVRPRFALPAPRVEITTPEAPRRSDGNRVPLLASLAPLLLSGALALAMRSPVMLLFALMSPVLLLGQWWSDRRHGRRSHRRMLREHVRLLETVARQTNDALAQEVRRRRSEHPDLCTVLELAGSRGARLWERRPGDQDWLVLRVGTGRLPSRIVRSGAPVGEHPEVAAVPATVDLQRTAVVGVAGARAARLSLAGSLVAQACAWHSPRRLRLVVLTGADVAAGDWAWALLLPHLLDHQAGELPCQAGVRERARLASLVASLGALITDRQATPSMSMGGSRGEADPPTAGNVLVVLDGARELRSVPGVAELLRLGPAAGLRFLCLDDDRSSLPTEATSVVDLHDRGHRATVTFPDQVVSGITLDLPRPGWLDQMGRAIAPLIDATPREEQATLPARVGFRELHRSLGFDPLDRRDLETAWSRPLGPPRALLGLTAKGPHEIDLARDGPHALVGGTTGSGKSELVQALVIGLAAAHRPDDLGFVLVDYKGGAAFRECARLPHTLGVVTDLDEHLTARALTSLTAELQRRERVLAEAGAKDLDSFHRLDSKGKHHPRLPRLVIVVDEFKLLADELPDFVDGLVRIAAKGRSLGVHLVLATQRPAGIITGDMRSNVSLRICLRVRDRADSEDVINDPAASALTDLAPGRAYLRAGDGRLVALQTAHVGGPVEAPGAERRVVVTRLSDDPIAIPSVRPPTEAAGVFGEVDEASTGGGPAEVSELAAFVEVARQVASMLGITAPRSPWLPPLPEWLGVDDLADRRSSSAGPGHPQPPDGVPFGLVDRPHVQQQVVARWAPDVDGHLGVIGGSRSGRTTLVRTVVTALARRHPVSGLHVHVLEGTPGPLRSLTELPHVGSVVDATDVALVRRLVERLGEDVFGSPTTRPELVVLVVDGWEAIEDAFDGGAAGPGPDALLRLIRDGAPLGLRVIVTGGRAVGSGRLSSLLDRRLVLPMPDPLDLALAGVEPAATRRLRSPGRAIDLADGSDLQVATIGSDPSHDEQLAALRRIGASLREATDSPLCEGPWRILPLPRLVSARELEDRMPSPGSQPATAPVDPLRVWLGVGGDGAEPTAVDVSGPARRFLVLGPSRSGRSNVLELAARQLVAGGRKVAVVATRRSPLQALVGERNVHLVLPEDGQRFVDLQRSHPDVAVLVDDAESLDRGDLEGALAEWARVVDESGGLIWASADTARANAAFRGLIPAVARDGIGIILGASAAADGDCLQARPDPVGRSVPGRGSLVVDSRCLPIQVARVAPLEAPKGRVPDGRHTGGVAARLVVR